MYMGYKSDYMYMHDVQDSIYNLNTSLAVHLSPINMILRQLSIQTGCKLISPIAGVKIGY